MKSWTPQSIHETKAQNVGNNFVACGNVIAYHTTEKNADKQGTPRAKMVCQRVALNFPFHFWRKNAKLGFIL